MGIRQEAVAGMFYPARKDELKGMVSGFISNVPEMDFKSLKAIIVPHAGYVYSGQVAAYGFSLLKKSKPKKIIILGPSHFVDIEGIRSDANEEWKMPFENVSLIENNIEKSMEAHKREHSLEVEVPFLQCVLDEFKIMPLVAGNADPAEIAEQILPYLKDSFLVISSDLSHYHDYDIAVSIDKNTLSSIANLDYSKMLEEGEACGKIPILAAIILAKKLGWKCKLLQYRNSGDVTGEKGGVVGYASLALYK
ncbi:AmmeMemoRadiSam system protein B [Candidatus Woesearchaeota archaeon]|nr:AmmeMemoRadiSam system protein B [Candidatus Woesearchaeota archaeon]